MDATGKRYERDHTEKSAKGPTDWKWFITPTAVKEWMALTDRSGDGESQEFRDALCELGAVSLVAELALEASERREGGGSLYRAPAIAKGKRLRRGSKGARVECTVMPPLRKEGDLPQLVRVTLK